MSVSLIMYPVRDSNSISTETDLQDQVEENVENSFYLGKYFIDIGNVLNNKIEWDDLFEKNGYKAIMGINFEPKPWYAVIGFLNNTQSSEIYEWLISLNIVDENSYSSFIDTYSSGEVKSNEMLSRNVMYNDFYKPMLAFYKKTIKEGKGILFTLE